MSIHPDVLILGGGIIGLTTSYWLARAGLHVEVVDQGGFGQESSWAGAGILTPGSSEHARTPYEMLRARSVAMFPSFSAELRERTGIDNGYRVTGGLEIVQNPAEELSGEWRSEGIPCELLGGHALHRLEPALNPALEKAYFLPGMAQLRNPRHLKALLAGCESHGVILRPGCPVHGFEREQDRVTAVNIGTSRRSAGRYLVAAGAWSDALLQQVGWRPGIHPVRGQIALLNTGVPLLGRILMQGKRYLVPRPDGRVLVGSTEENAGFDKRTTSVAVHELLGFALALAPALREASLERTWAGLRPGSPDGLPLLGPVPAFENLFVAAGHFRAGIQLSPITAQLMQELLLDQEPSVALEPFRMDRCSEARWPTFQS